MSVSDDSRADVALSIVAVYFFVGGVIGFIGLVIQAISVLNGAPGEHLVGPGPMYMAIVGGGLGALWMLAGILVWRRHRRGPLLALVTLAVSLVDWFWAPPSLTGLLIVLLLLALIGVSWRALNVPPAREGV